MTSPAGVVAVVAWKTQPSNLPLVQGWRRLGLKSELLAPSDARRRLGAGDTALVRLDVTPALDGVEPGLSDIVALRSRGVRVLNRPAALLAAHDKLATARQLRESGIPHPHTTHAENVADIRGFEPPFVLKPRFGSWGRHVVLCRAADELDDRLAELARLPWFRRHGVLIQELVPPAGRDLRLIVAGSRVVGASERRAAPGEWRTNEALGGHSRPAAPSDDACRLALEAAAAIGGDLMGVDLLPLPDGGHVVIEVNAAVDFDTTDALRGRDLYADAADALQLTRARQPLTTPSGRSRTTRPASPAAATTSTTRSTSL